MSPPRYRPFEEGEEGLLLPVGAFGSILLEVLERGDSIRFRAGGFSMVPLIMNGDVITVGPLSRRGVATGDVIAFRRSTDDKILTHRVIVDLHDCLVTKGDAAVFPDGMITLDRVIGRVTRVERDGRLVRAGWGRERRLIAMLSRHRLLIPLVAYSRKLRAGWERLR